VYVCLCNGLTDRQVHDAISSGTARLSEVYAACGCQAQCGHCAPSMLCLLRERLANQAAAGDD
jgi:bacterioferritin-associated ferredoxin